MPDDQTIDDQLRSLAQAAIVEATAGVQIDGELVHVHQRIIDEALATPQPPDTSGQRARWLAAAAATVLVAAGVVAIAWPGRTNESPVASVPSVPSLQPSTVPTTDTPTVSATPQAVTTLPNLTWATAHPNPVVAGEPLTITPVGVVARACLDIVTAIDPDAGTVLGQILDGNWVATTDGAQPTYPACAGVTSDATVRLVVPSDMPPRTYGLCLTSDLAPAGCAVVTVTAGSPDQPSDSLPPGTALPAMPTGFFGQRVLDEPPYFAVDEFDSAGTQVASLDTSELTSLIARQVLPDGSTVQLDRDLLNGRCQNAALTRVRNGVISSAHVDVTAARSVAASTDGRVIAALDVCPEGTRWGDVGTRHDVVSFLPGSSEPPTVLLSRPADPDEILFDGGDVIYANGEQIVESVSPDGRFVMVLDAYEIEQWRWQLLDMSNPGESIELSSGCPIPGDIVAAPRFLDDGRLVVARVCATVADVEPSPYDSVGNGDIHVELIDLNGGAPGSLIWHRRIEGLQPDGYNRTAAVSATVAEDGSVWVIVTGGSDVEQHGRSFVLHGDDITEITRTGYSGWSFEPSDLIFADLLTASTGG